MILNNKKITIDSIFLINLLFAFFPISFIIGNFATNANMFLLCILGIFHLRSKIFTAKLNFSIKIIFLLFCIVIFSTILSLIKSLYFGEYESYNFFKLLKSILFFRFFIMLLIIYLLNELNIINFKYFFITACFFTFLISLDVIYQYIFGFNIIGLESFYYHNSSFFGDELISGIYIQHFSFFSIFLLAYFLKKKNNFLKILLVTIGICILATGIIFSGNRMPFILFLLGLILIFLLNKKLRTTVLISFMSIFIIFGYINSFDSKIKEKYRSFYFYTKKILQTKPKEDKQDQSNIELIEKSSNSENHSSLIVEFDSQLNRWVVFDPESLGYKGIYFTAWETWKRNKIFGNGIKSFREDCKKIINKNSLCSNHPHNYYLEILTDLGMIGFIFVLIIASIFISFLLKNYKSFNNNNLENLFLLGATISLFLEVFPIKSSGSIFTTSNATYIMLMASIILSHKKLLKGENFK